MLHQCKKTLCAKGVRVQQILNELNALAVEELRSKVADLLQELVVVVGLILDLK
jgi:hypothetical protein